MSILAGILTFAGLCVIAVVIVTLGAWLATDDDDEIWDQERQV